VFSTTQLLTVTADVIDTAASTLVIGATENHDEHPQHANHGIKNHAIFSRKPHFLVVQNRPVRFKNERL